MAERSFTPCSPICPDVTGKSYGSVRYCPMAQNNRHRRKGSSRSNHPDYTDCCANFQCCADLWKAAGLEHVAASLVTASEEGRTVVPVSEKPSWGEGEA